MSPVKHIFLIILNTFRARQDITKKIRCLYSHVSLLISPLNSLITEEKHSSCFILKTVYCESVGHQSTFYFLSADWLNWSTAGEEGG